jgi:hypothetical protein
MLGMLTLAHEMMIKEVGRRTRTEKEKTVFNAEAFFLSSFLYWF